MKRNKVKFNLFEDHINIGINQIKTNH